MGRALGVQLGVAGSTLVDADEVTEFEQAYLGHRGLLSGVARCGDSRPTDQVIDRRTGLWVGGLEANELDLDLLSFGATAVLWNAETRDLAFELRAALEFSGIRSPFDIGGLKGIGMRRDGFAFLCGDEEERE